MTERLRELRALVREYADRMQDYLTMLDGVAGEGGTTDDLIEDPRVEEAFRHLGQVAHRLETTVEATYGEDTPLLGVWSDEDDDPPQWREPTQWHHMVVEMDVSVREGLDGGDIQVAIEPHVERVVEDLERQGWAVGFHHVIEAMELPEDEDEEDDSGRDGQDVA